MIETLLSTMFVANLKFPSADSDAVWVPPVVIVIRARLLAVPQSVSRDDAVAVARAKALPWSRLLCALY